MGGKVLLSEGELVLASPVQMVTDLHLEGMGRATRLKVGDGEDINALVIPGGGASDIVLSHFTIDGNNANNTAGDGVKATNLTSGLLCLDIAVVDMADDGFSGNIFTDASFTNCLAQGCGIRGFVLLGLNSRVVYLGCRALNNGIGFSPDLSSYVSFFGCIAKDNSSIGYDIFRTDYASVIGCSAIDNGGIGIKESSGAPSIGFNVFTGNTVDGNAGGNILRAFANSIIRDNIGHITENSGTATITDPATTVVIAHGLDVTPAVDDITVTLAENPTNDPGNIWVDTIGAANFTINCRNAPGASDLDLAWRAAVL